MSYALDKKRRTLCVAWEAHRRHNIPRESLLSGRQLWSSDYEDSVGFHGVQSSSRANGTAAYIPLPGFQVVLRIRREELPSVALCRF
jgi:hypothetical protein